jgi:hypothetical protein
MTRAVGTPFQKLLKHPQLIPALHSIENHEFWYCSRSRLLHNSSKNYWQLPKYMGNEEV